MNEEMLQALYNKLGLQSKVDFETFKTDIKDNPEMQEAIYNKLNLKDKVDLNTFKNDLGANSTSSSYSGILKPHQRAFIDSIADKESGGRYNIITGNKITFDDYSKHPNIVGVVTPEGPSTAAGKYQITNQTWQELQKELNLPDFSPQSQDIAAWHLAQKRYKINTGRDLDQDLQSNDITLASKAQQVLGPTWIALKTDKEFINRYYDKYNRYQQEQGLQDSSQGIVSFENDDINQETFSQNEINRLYAESGGDPSKPFKAKVRRPYGTGSIGKALRSDWLLAQNNTYDIDFESEDGSFKKTVKFQDLKNAGVIEQVGNAVGSMLGTGVSQVASGIGWLVGATQDVFEMATGTDSTWDKSQDYSSNFLSEGITDSTSLLINKSDQFQNIEDRIDVASQNQDHLGVISGYLAKLSTPEFWATEGAQGVGSLLGGLIPGMGASKAVRGASFLSKALTKIPGVSKKLGEKIVEYGVGSSINSLSEAAVESGQIFEDVLQDGISKGLSEEEARTRAADYASEVFGNNYATLMLFNAVELGGVTGALSKGIKNSVGRFVANSGITSASEGTQEVVQYGITKQAERYKTEEEYDKSKVGLLDTMFSGESAFGGALSSAAKGLMEADPEAWGSGIFGALLGGIASAPGSAVDAYKHHKITKPVMKDVDAVLSSNFTDMYVRDQNGKPVMEDDKILIDGTKFFSHLKGIDGFIKADELQEEASKLDKNDAVKFALSNKVNAIIYSNLAKGQDKENISEAIDLAFDKNSFKTNKLSEHMSYKEFKAIKDDLMQVAEEKYDDIFSDPSIKKQSASYKSNLYFNSVQQELLNREIGRLESSLDTLSNKDKLNSFDKLKQKELTERVDSLNNFKNKLEEAYNNLISKKKEDVKETQKEDVKNSVSDSIKNNEPLTEEQEKKVEKDPDLKKYAQEQLLNKISSQMDGFTTDEEYDELNKQFPDFSTEISNHKQNKLKGLEEKNGNLSKVQSPSALFPTKQGDTIVNNRYGEENKLQKKKDQDDLNNSLKNYLENRYSNLDESIQTEPELQGLKIHIDNGGTIDNYINLDSTDPNDELLRIALEEFKSPGSQLPAQRKETFNAKIKSEEKFNEISKIIDEDKDLNYERAIARIEDLYNKGELLEQHRKALVDKINKKRNSKPSEIHLEEESKEKDPKPESKGLGQKVSVPTISVFGIDREINTASKNKSSINIGVRIEGVGKIESEIVFKISPNEYNKYFHNSTLDELIEVAKDRLKGNESLLNDFEKYVNEYKESLIFEVLPADTNRFTVKQESLNLLKGLDISKAKVYYKIEPSDYKSTKKDLDPNSEDNFFISVVLFTDENGKPISKEEYESNKEINKEHFIGIIRTNQDKYHIKDGGENITEEGKHVKNLRNKLYKMWDKSSTMYSTPLKIENITLNEERFVNGSGGRKLTTAEKNGYFDVIISDYNQSSEDPANLRFANEEKGKSFDFKVQAHHAGKVVMFLKLPNGVEKQIILDTKKIKDVPYKSQELRTKLQQLHESIREILSKNKGNLADPEVKKSIDFLVSQAWKNIISDKSSAIVRFRTTTSSSDSKMSTDINKKNQDGGIGPVLLYDIETDEYLFTNTENKEELASANGNDIDTVINKLSESRVHIPYEQEALKNFILEELSIEGNEDVLLTDITGKFIEPRVYLQIDDNISLENEKTTEEGSLFDELKDKFAETDNIESKQSTTESTANTSNKTKIEVPKPNNRRMKLKVSSKNQPKIATKDEAKNYIKDRFSEINVTVSDKALEIISEIYNVGGAKIWGAFQNSVVYLASDAGLNVGKHEAFHIVFNLFLDEKQKANVLKEAHKLYGKELGISKEEFEKALSEDLYPVDTKFKVEDSIKDGVSELFESNPELANAVYEALGFNNYNVELKPYATDVWGKVPQQRGDNSFVAKEQYSIKLGEDKGIDVRLTIYFDDSNKTAFVSNIENFENDRTHPLKKGLGLKGFLKANQLIINRGYTPVVDNLVSGYGYDMLSKLEKSGYLTKVLDKRVVNSQYDNVKYERSPFIFTNKIYEPELTPQQKQQAQQLYSQYLNTIFPDSKVKDIEGFKEFVKQQSIRLKSEEEYYKKQNPLIRLEERLAEVFEEYKADLGITSENFKKNYPIIAKFLDELYNFIYDIYQRVKPYLTNNLSINDIFYQLDKNILGKEYFGFGQNRRKEYVQRYNKNFIDNLNKASFKIADFKEVEKNAFVDLISIHIMDLFLQKYEEGRYHNVQFGKLKPKVKEALITNFLNSLPENIKIWKEDGLFPEDVEMRENMDRIIEAYNSPEYNYVFQQAIIRNINRVYDTEFLIEDEIDDEAGAKIVRELNVDPKTNVTSQLKAYLSLVPRKALYVDENGKEEWVDSINKYTGAPNYFTFEEIYRNLLIYFSDLPSKISLFEKLNDHADKYYCKKIIDDITKGIAADLNYRYNVNISSEAIRLALINNSFEVELGKNQSINFFKEFNRNIHLDTLYLGVGSQTNKTILNTIKDNNNGIKVYDTSLVNSNNEIYDDVRASFERSSINLDKFSNVLTRISEEIARTKSTDEVRHEIKQADIKYLFNDFGFKINEDFIDDLFSLQGSTFNNMMRKIYNSFATIYNESLSSTDKDLQNPFVITTNKDLKQKLSGAISELVGVIKEHDLSYKHLTTLTINGENMFIHQMPNHLSKMVSMMKKDPKRFFKRYVENKLMHQHLPLFQNLKPRIDSTGNIVQGTFDKDFKVVYDGGYADKGEFSGKEYKDYDAKDIKLQNLYKFFHPSKQNKSNRCIVGLPVFSDAQARAYVNTRRFSDKRQIVSKLAETVYAELERISFSRKFDTGNVSFDKYGKDFVLFPFLNQNEKLKENLIKNFESGKYTNEDGVITISRDEELVKELNNYLDSLTKTYINQLIDLNIVEEQQGYYHFTSEADQMAIVGKIIPPGSSTETMITIDLEKVNKPENTVFMQNISNYIYNQYYYNTQFFPAFAGDPAFYGKNTYEDLSTNMLKRFKEVHSPRQSATFTDREGNLIKDRRLYFDDIEIQEDEQTLKELREVFPELAKGFLEGHNITDAQFINFPDHTESILRANHDLTEEDLAEIDNIKNIKPSNFNFGVEKGFYFDQVEQTVHTSNEKYVTYLKPFQKKSSEYTLVPEMSYLTKNGEVRRPKNIADINQNFVRPRLAKMYYLYEKMAQEGVSLSGIGFKSAVKVDEDSKHLVNMGKPKKGKELIEGGFDAFDFDQKDNYDKLKALVFETDMEGYGRQNSVPKDKHFEKKGAMGSQFNVIVTADMDLNERIDISIEGDNKSLSQREYAELWQESEVLDIDEQLHGSEDVKGLREVFSDEKKMSEIVLKNAIKMNYSEDSILARELFKEGDNRANLPFEHFMYAFENMKIFNSYFKKAIRSKAPKGVFVNASSMGFTDNTTKIQNDLNIVYKKDANNKIVGIDYVECAVPATNKVLMNYVNENGLIDVQKMSKNMAKEDVDRMLEAVGYRIPTEGAYSIYPLKIKYILPVNSDAIIILPKQATTVTGLDFDVDKLFVHFNHFKVEIESSEKFRKLVKKKLKSFVIGDETDSIVELTEDEINHIAEKVLDKEFDDQLDRYYEVINLLKEELKYVDVDTYLSVRKIYYTKPSMSTMSGRHNLRMELARQRMKLNSFARSFLKGGNTNEIDKIINTLEKSGYKFDSGVTKDICAPDHQDYNAQKAVVGGAVIGIAANHNKHHAVIQNTDEIKLSEFATIKGFFSDKPFDVLNNIKKGMNFISENIASVLFASTEHIKNPKLDKIGINKQNASVVLTGLRLGMDFDKIIFLINQKSILDLNKEFSKLTDNTKYEDFIEERFKKMFPEGLDYLKEKAIENGINPLDVLSFKGNNDAEYLKEGLFTSDVGKKKYNGSINQHANMLREYKIMSTYLKLVKIDSELNTVMRITKFDTEGSFGPTLYDNLKSIADIADYNNKETSVFADPTMMVPQISYTTEDGNGYSVKIVRPSKLKLVDGYINIMVQQMNLLSPHFNALSYEFSYIYEDMKQLTGNKNVDMRSLHNDVFAYLSSKPNVLFSEGTNLLDEINRTSKEFNDLSKNPEYKEKYKAIFNFLRTKSKGQLSYLIRRTKGKLSETEQGTIRNTWAEMMEDDDPKVSELARRIAKVSIFTSNFSYKYEGFSHLIPINFFTKTEEGLLIRKIYQEASSILRNLPEFHNSRISKTILEANPSHARQVYKSNIEPVNDSYISIPTTNFFLEPVIVKAPVYFKVKKGHERKFLTKGNEFVEYISYGSFYINDKKIPLLYRLVNGTYVLQESNGDPTFFLNTTGSDTGSHPIKNEQIRFVKNKLSSKDQPTAGNNSSIIENSAILEDPVISDEFVIDSEEEFVTDYSEEGEFVIPDDTEGSDLVPTFVEEDLSDNAQNFEIDDEFISIQTASLGEIKDYIDNGEVLFDSVKKRIVIDNSISVPVKRSNNFLLLNNNFFSEENVKKHLDATLDDEFNDARKYVYDYVAKNGFSKDKIYDIISKSKRKYNSFAASEMYSLILMKKEHGKLKNATTDSEKDTINKEIKSILNKYIDALKQLDSPDPKLNPEDNSKNCEGIPEFSL